MTLPDLTDLLDRQLRANGYHLTAAELRDVASQLLMSLDCPDEPQHTGDTTWRPSDQGGRA